MPNDEIGLKVLHRLEASPRDLVSEFGFSLGKINYCMRVLVHKGWIKSNRFRDSDKELAYRHPLTPRGIGEKAALTARLLRIKMCEYQSSRDRSWPAT